MVNTKYATGLAEVSVGDSRLERLYVHNSGQQEIRPSWWPGGRFVPRPLDEPEPVYLALLSAGMKQGIFTRDFVIALVKAGNDALADPKSKFA